MIGRHGLLVGLAAVSSDAFAQNVLVLGTPSSWTYNFDVQINLTSDGRIPDVDIYEIEGASPDAADLAQYDAVFVYAEQPFLDPEGLGDLLADYVDGGGGLVVGAYAFSNGHNLGGRLVADGYVPLTLNGTDSGVAGPQRMIREVRPYGTHEVFLNVVNFYGGPGSFHSAGVQVAPGAELLARWENGEPLVAVSEPSAGRVVALNFFPPSNLLAPYYPPAAQFWDAVFYPPDGSDPIPTTQGAQLMTSAVLWSIGQTTTCFNTLITQDLNCNGVDEQYEGVVDPLEPECDGVDPATRNQDWYFDYAVFGCEYEVSGQDQDADGLGDSPTRVLPDDGTPYPDQVGPTCDNCAQNYNPDQRNIECDGAGDVCDVCPTIEDMGMDQDGDKVGDDCDNCGRIPNANQDDGDYDLTGDVCDNCYDVYNPDQADGGVTGAEEGLQPDGVGNACDNCINDYNAGQTDADNDGVGDVCDNCPNTPNPDQANSDPDPLGDACDLCPGDGRQNLKDSDADGVGDLCDVCKFDPDPLQTDVDNDGQPDACDNCPLAAGPQNDGDGDAVGDTCDNCPDFPNADQADVDIDGVGDLCDNAVEVFNPSQEDSDFGKNEVDQLIPLPDGVGDVIDNCVDRFNPDQQDRDDDGLGDVCDNCPSQSNAAQDDADQDGTGDLCDYQIRGGGAEARCDAVGATSRAWFGLALLAAAVRRRR